MATAIVVRRALRARASARKAKILRRFFKTGPGEYGAGDVFLGVVVPDIRGVVSEFSTLNPASIRKLLCSKVHEERLTALLIMVHQYERGTLLERRHIFRTYLKSTRCVNNWDLVDLTAPNIVGFELWGRSTAPLTRLARSRSLWERRIAVLATLAFIRRGSYTETLSLARLLLKDKHDLMHKAVGWMLREVGKRSPKTLERFLITNYRRMPRTMLRYAIERLPEQRRQAYLTGAI